MTLREQVAQLRAELADAEFRLNEFRSAFDHHLRFAIESHLTELIDHPELLRAALLARAQKSAEPVDLLAALRAMTLIDEHAD